MTLKSYLWSLRVGTLLSFSAWGLVVFFIDPKKSGIGGQFIFYFSFFLVLSGIFILLLTRLKKISKKEELAFAEIGINFREGILLSLLVIILLILQSFRILVWWDGLLVVAGIFMIELYFLTK